MEDVAPGCGGGGNDESAKEDVVIATVDYETYINEAHGYANVKVMEGGIMAWPFPREK